MELCCDAIAVVLRQEHHALFLGQVLANEPVGVFVGPAFPRMVRRREVEAGAGALLDRGVAVELGPVVRRDGPHGTRLRRISCVARWFTSAVVRAWSFPMAT